MMRCTIFGLALLLWAGCYRLAFSMDSSVADAAMTGDRATVDLLLHKKADVNAAQTDGATALEWAAYRDDLEIAGLLIASGANPKIPNREGATALQLASLHGSAAMIEKLLNAGALVNERGLNGETPLMFAARNGNLDALLLLLKRGADVNAKEALRGTTALMWAVKLLIEHGAAVNVASSADSKGGTACLAPTVKQREQQEQFIRQRRAIAAKEAAKNPVEDLAASDAAAAAAAFGVAANTKGGGLTPLTLAAREDCIECARILVGAHAGVNQTTRYGWTPLLTAVQNRHYQLAA
jgi:ankyrin repeat protein